MEHKVWCVCNGEGWVWGHELPHDADYVTDTRYPEWRAEGSFNDRQDAIMEVERRAARWDGAEFIAREAEYRVVDVVDSEASFK